MCERVYLCVNVPYLQGSLVDVGLRRMAYVDRAIAPGVRVTVELDVTQFQKKSTLMLNALRRMIGRAK